MITAAETVIQQFRDAYLDYFPQYLDVLTEMYGMDIKSWPATRETKAGRRLSAATKGSLADAHEHMSSAIDILAALMDDEAGEVADEDDPDATSEAKAAAKAKSEPEALHSAAETLDAMRALLRA